MAGGDPPGAQGMGALTSLGMGRPSAPSHVPWAGGVRPRTATSWPSRRQSLSRPWVWEGRPAATRGAGRIRGLGSEELGPALGFGRPRHIRQLSRPDLARWRVRTLRVRRHMPTLWDSMCRSVRGWQGHVVGAAPRSSPAAGITRWRGGSWWRTVQALGQPIAEAQCVQSAPGGNWWPTSWAPHARKRPMMGRCGRSRLARPSPRALDVGHLQDAPGFSIPSGPRS